MPYSVRRLQAGDEEMLDAFLIPHTPFAYFMRSNMRRGGLVYEDGDYQADYFAAFEADKLLGLLAHSWIGSVQVFALDPLVVAPLGHAWHNYLKQNPREVGCFLGPALHVQALLDALAIQPDFLRKGGTEEWLFTLELKRLVMPELLKKDEIHVRLARSEDIMQLIPWRHNFYVEALGDPAGEDTRIKAEIEIRRRVQEEDLFVLECKKQLVSFCGAGGFLDDWKMIGPVWTPPEQRGKGYARAVVAGALASLYDKGAQHAVLFAHNQAAERAYNALGFERIADWRLDFLTMPTSRL